MPKKRKQINKKLIKKDYQCEKYEEAKLRKWFTINDMKVFNDTGIELIDCEVFLPKALTSLKKEIHYTIYNEDIKLEKEEYKGIGRIDYIFKYKGSVYICETKCYPFKSTEFWDSLKVLGYTAYYNWYRGTSYKPAIMIPKKHAKLEHFIVALALKIKIFGITKSKERYKIEEIEADKK